MQKSKIAREYRKKYPNYPTLKLARVIYNDNNLLFKDVEDARSVLRYLEGKKGKDNLRKTVVASEFYKEESRPKNPYNLPESYQEKREIFKLPLACNNILLISDLHIPYHDIDAVTLALDYGKENNINTIFINGDLIDNHQVSKFESDPKKRSVKQEFDATKQFLKSLREVFPDASIYWLKGNHCIRWEKFLLMKVREIWDDDYFHLEQRLQLNDVKVTLLDDKTLVKAGKLAISHGHHIFKGIFSPVSPARGAWMKAKQSIIVGHLHRASHHPEIDLDGNVYSAWSTGCLCELRPNYSPLVSNSQHGFAHIKVELNGDYTVKNYQIINGKLH
ncbi:MPP_superfamily domain containing protein [uncultured Caudovirales phage]|uniref:MPP_superfamily domain containing protein n=1 Tax=uncultured Caudovirales phage TaxID=2100421 RepID=A0A6J7WL67_9CAUD|nr:MPP_superfamily domain containing protein [uncultured Caudovirales phage]